MKYWFEKRADRLDKERRAFESLGVPCTIDPDLKKSGVIRIKIPIRKGNPNFDIPDGFGDLEFIAVYPDHYPYFRPQLYELNLELARHQNPIEKNLCLLEMSTIHWSSTSLLAEVMQEQLPKLLRKGLVTDPNIIGEDDTEQAEPVVAYYATSEHLVIFSPPEPPLTLLETGIRFIGEIEAGFRKDAVFPETISINRTSLQSGDVIALPDIIQQQFPKHLPGLLYQLSERPPQDPKKALSWLRQRLAEEGESLKLPNKNLELKNGMVRNIVGFAFPDEVEKGGKGTSWLFVVEGFLNTPVKSGRVKRNGSPRLPISNYLRSTDIALLSHNQRVPLLRPLGDKKIAVVGLGALGSFISIELARAGVKQLNLLDHDTVDTANAVRWPLGLQAVGFAKCEILARFIRLNYPFVEVASWSRMLGSVRARGKGGVVSTHEAEVIEDLFNGVSMLIDATAEFGVHHFLSREAWHRGIPYICAYATAGAWGGSVMRQIPGKTGCWSCFMHREQEESVAVIQEDKSHGTIQPPGCAEKTFTGSNFDLQQIVLATVRMAVSTLCSNEGGYKDTGFDIARLNLVDAKGNPILPEWKGYTLETHPECYYCNDTFC